MSQKNPHSHQHETGFGTEPDKTPAVSLIVSLCILAFFMVVLVYGLQEWHAIFTQEEVHLKIETVEDRRLKALRAVEIQHLTQYRQIDDKKINFQIPIDQAMNKLVSQPKLLGGLSVK